MRAGNDKEYRIKHKDKKALYDKEYGKVNKDKIRNRQKVYYLKKRYGITLEEYNKLLAEQDNCCAICGKHISELYRILLVDHSHDTGEVRGLLCDTCNAGLGMFHDNIIIMEEAIKYLKNTSHAGR